MQLLEQAEIVDVRNDSDELVFTCLKKDEGKIVEVKWSKGQYDAAIGRIVPNDEKTEQVNEWCKEYFDLDLMSINKAVGRKMDVYIYESFASFWESDAKFKVEDAGEKFETTIHDVEVMPDAIVVRYKWQGEIYRTNYRFTRRFGEDYFVDPTKERRQRERFENTFGLPVERAEELVGLPIQIEVKKAYGKFAYGDLSIPK